MTARRVRCRHRRWRTGTCGSRCALRGQHQESVGLNAPAVGHDPGDRLLVGGPVFGAWRPCVDRTPRGTWAGGPGRATRAATRRRSGPRHPPGPGRARLRRRPGRLGLLEALLPGLVRLAGITGYDDPAAIEEIVSLAWERIRTYPPGHWGSVAANVLLDVRKRYRAHCLIWAPRSLDTEEIAAVAGLSLVGAIVALGLSGGPVTEASPPAQSSPSRPMQSSPSAARSPGSRSRPRCANLVASRSDPAPAA